MRKIHDTQTPLETYKEMTVAAGYALKDTAELGVYLLYHYALPYLVLAAVFFGSLWVATVGL